MVTIGSEARSRARLLFVGGIVALTTFGVSAQVDAASPIPRTLSTSAPVLRTIAPGRTLVRTISLPWRANMIGATWTSKDATASGLAMSVRALSPNTTPWTKLDVDQDIPDGPEAKHMLPRLAADASWIGDADTIQIEVRTSRVASPVRSLQIVALNSNGDAYPVGFFTRAFRAVRNFLTMQPKSADAYATIPAIIKRSQWGVSEGMPSGCPGYGPAVQFVEVHHTDNSNSYTKSQSYALVRGIWHYHVYTLGYCDIAYNFLVDKYGQIFEGRGGGIDKPVIGAHAGGFNRASVGIAAIGNYSTAYPTSALLHSLERLIAWRMDVAHIPAIGTLYYTTMGGSNKYSAGTTVKLNRIIGHRNTSYTNCPGNHLYADLPTIRKAVNGIGTPKIYLPSVSSWLLRPDGDGHNDSVTFHATFSGTVAWTLTIIAPDNSTARRFTGAGTSMSQTWDGTSTVPATLVPSGIYRWTLAAQNSASSARPASGSLYVVTTHPEGTILRDDSHTYWLNGASSTQTIADQYAYNSTFISPSGSAASAVSTGPAEVNDYAPAVSSMTPRDGALFSVAASGTDPARYYIWSAGALKKFAFDPTTTPSTDQPLIPASAFTTVPDTEISALSPSSPAQISDSSVHPAGMVVQDANGQRWQIQDDGTTLKPISALVFATMYRSSELVGATTDDLSSPRQELATTTASDWVSPRDGAIFTDGSHYWIWSGGGLRAFHYAALYTTMGYTSTMAFHTSAAALSGLPAGARIG